MKIKKGGKPNEKPEGMKGCGNPWALRTGRRTTIASFPHHANDHKGPGSSKKNVHPQESVMNHYKKWLKKPLPNSKMKSL